MLSGYKTYAAGIGMILVAIGGAALRLAGRDEFSLSFDEAANLFLAGLAVLGVGHKLDKLQSGRRFGMLLALALGICATPSQAADISGPSEVAACSGLVRLSTTVDEGHVLRWEAVSPRRLDMVSYGDGSGVAFAAPSQSQVVTVLLVDVWQDADGPRVQTTLHDITVRGPPRPGPEPDPDPDPQPDPDPEPDPQPDPDPPPEPDVPPVVPDDLTGIARTAFVEAWKVPAASRGLADPLADSFASVASSIAAGTTRSIDAAKTEIAEKVNAVLGANTDAWQSWRTEIGYKLDELQSVGLLRTVQDYAEQCRAIATGLRRVSNPQSDARPESDAASSQKGGKSGDSKTSSIGNTKSASDFRVVTIGGKRYGQDKVTGQLYLVDESTDAFCVGDKCFIVRD